MLSFKHINFISPFHGKGSTVSRLQGHYEGTVYFNYQVPRISYHSFTPQSHLGHCPRDSLHHDVNHWKLTYFDQEVTGYLNSKGSLKKRRHRCFPMIFTIFFKTIFLCNTREQVLLVIALLNRNLNWFPLKEVYRSLKIKKILKLRVCLAMCDLLVDTRHQSRALSRDFLRTTFFEMVLFSYRHRGCLGVRKVWVFNTSDPLTTYSVESKREVMILLASIISTQWKLLSYFE